MFLYPDWWINENIRLIEELEKPAIVNFPPREIVANRIDAILAFDRTADLPRVRTPTLILCTKDDVLTPPYYSRELARLIPGAEHVELDRGGNYCRLRTSRAGFHRPTSIDRLAGPRANLFPVSTDTLRRRHRPSASLAHYRLNDQS